MSIKNLPYNQNKLILENFEAHNAFTIKENINTITHQVDQETGEYVIKNANNPDIIIEIIIPIKSTPDVFLTL